MEQPHGFNFRQSFVRDWALYLRARVAASFRSLREPSYRAYWGTQLVSLTGTWMQTVAQSWLVLEISGSAVALGTVVSAQFLPILFLSLFAGVIVDRLPRRRVLLVTQSLSALQAAAMAGLVLTGVVQLWHIYLLAAFLGFVNAVDTPARQSFIADLVKPEDVQNAVALNSTLFNAARLMGPALGGLAILYLGIGGCFLLNSLSFLPLLAALGTVIVEGQSRYGPPKVQRALLRGVAEGLTYAFGHPDISVAVIMLAFIGTFGYNFTVLLALLAKFAFNTGAEGLGAMTSAMGLGSLMGALLVAGRSKPSRRLLFAGAVGFAVAEALLAFVALGFPLFAGLVVLAVLGLLGIIYTTTTNALLQLGAPAHLRGRIVSLYVLLFAGSTPIGGAFTGVMVEWIGLQATIGLEALLCFVGIFLALLSLQLRKRRVPSDHVL